MNLKYLGASFICGAVWGAIAFLLGHGVAPEDQLVAGVLASPFIGFLVGVISSPAYSLPKVARAFVPVFLLFLSAALFAIAMSARSKSDADLAQNLGGVLIGTAWNVVILLPFAYLTHYGLGYLRTPKVKPH